MKLNKILVVDDDRTFRHPVSNLLTAAGYAVAGAAEGQSGNNKSACNRHESSFARALILL